MDLKVFFLNPNLTSTNQQGASYVVIENILDWKTDHGELHVFKSDEDRPTTVFANRQWIWAEEQQQEDSEKNSQQAPANGSRVVSRPRHSALGSSDRRKSDVTDLSYPDAGSIERNRAASVEFAINNRTVPWSEAHMKAVLDYEREVALEFGPEAVDKLPWNRIPRGEDAKRRIERG